VKNKWLIGIASLAALSATAFFVLNQPAEAAKADTEETQAEPEKKETIYPVELISAEQRTMRTYVLSTATLRADRQVDIYSKVAGQVAELKVEEGLRVAEGDTLLTLDGDDERLKLEQARVDLNKAKAEYERVAKSYDKALISAEEHDKKKFELEQAQAKFDLANHQLSLTQVIAPFAGTITARNVEIGQTIQPSEKLFTLAALDPLEADLFLPESKVGALAAGMTAELSKSDDFSRGFRGAVGRIAPVVDQETGTVKATLTIASAPAEARPGTYVHVRVVTDEISAETVIPKKAVMFDSRQKPHVFKATQTEDPAIYKVHRTPITLGVEEDDYVQATEGLLPTDAVVLTGKESLKDGAKVRDASRGADQLAQAN